MPWAWVTKGDGVFRLNAMSSFDPISRAVALSLSPARIPLCPFPEELADVLSCTFDPFSQYRPADRMERFLQSSYEATVDFLTTYQEPVIPFFDVATISYPDDAINQRDTPLKKELPSRRTTPPRRALSALPIKRLNTLRRKFLSMFHKSESKVRPL
ncbi:hypothetical protein DSO57_1006313 [Entomophthora muscae]|uniref:Uncharacterized protein n=1 Tax=Entomophthora muscae TaxID=34485 RepID=A0ACC2T7F6_9FUNG|nr:hypothetical protein DSO57_1006313 [Entomophthora muscae]